MVCAVPLLRNYTEGGYLAVLSDHECLRWLLNHGEEDSDGHGRLAQVRLKLTRYDFRTRLKSGASHHSAYSVSRLHRGGAYLSPLEGDIPVVFVQLA